MNSSSESRPVEKDSVPQAKNILKCSGTSVIVDLNSGHDETTSSDSSNPSNEDETPDPSWFKAATILLSLKTSAEARLKGNQSTTTSSASPTWTPKSSPHNETNTPMANGAVNQSNGYHHHGNDYSCEEEGYESTKRAGNIENRFAFNGEQRESFEDDDDDDDDEIDKDLSTTCSLCRKVYSRPSTLKAHMRIHTGEKPFQCSICDKSFSQDANLKAHLRVHSKEKPFKCQICHRRFAQSSSVTTHMRIHSGERPYKCKVCSRGFADSSTLTKHLRIHTGEKPYQCKICDMRFSQSGNLSRHMRVHRRKK